MKILVTGYKGFIGQNMVKALEASHEVIGFEWGEEFPEYDFDLVMHLGAISSTTESNVEKVMTQNYDFSVWLLEMCNRRGINFQYSSSASVYGFGKEFKEDSPVDPKTPYAWSKYMFERYVNSKKWSVKVQGFRYFNVYGPGEEHKENQASPYHKFSKLAQTEGSFSIFENSNNFYRDFVHVDKVVSIHLQFINIPESGIWNIGSGKARSFLNVAQEIANKYNAKYVYVPMPENMKSSYQSYTCADLSKLNNVINKYSSIISE